MHNTAASSTPSSDMTPDSGIRSAAPVDSGTNSGLESEVSNNKRDSTLEKQ